MFNSEMIVGLWFVPVVLQIVIPLAILCIWSVQQVLKKITDKIELIHESSKEVRAESYVMGIQSGPVA